jgi:hypothetical protein
MKSRTEYLTFNLPERMAFENITERVAAIVAKSGVQEGLVLVKAKQIWQRLAKSGRRCGTSIGDPSNGRRLRSAFHPADFR